MKKAIIFFLFIGFAQLFPQKKRLTFEQTFLFSEPRLLKSVPSFVKWSDAGAVLKTGEKYILADFDFGINEYLNYNELISDLPPEYISARKSEIGKDLLYYILKSQGDLFYFSAEDNEYKRLTALSGDEQNPVFSPDYSKAAFTNNNNLFVADISSGLLRQLTDDGSETIKNGYASWVYYEEILGRSSNYRAYYWSGDSKKIAFLRFDDSLVPRFPLFNAEGTHGKLEWQHYPKAGDPDPKVWLCVADVSTGKITRIDSSLNSEKYIAQIFWTPENKLFYETVNRAQDSLHFYLYDFNSKTSRVIYSEFQPSWVEFIEKIVFTNDGFYFISDYKGYGKIFKYDYNGEKTEELGDDNLNLVSIRRVADNGSVFAEGFPLGSIDNHLYELNGNSVKKITKQSGYHKTYVSPNGEFLIDYYSNLTSPEKVIAINLVTGKDSVLFDSKTEYFDDYELAEVKSFYIENRDGIELPAIKFLPPDFDPEKKYPMLFSIYGGPGTPVVKNRFSRWLLPHFYASMGVIVVKVDNRAAGHYGKKVISQLHRNLGKYDVDDFIDAAEYMKSLPYVDSGKIGITGGSYGGYVTLLAMTRGANTFTHGLAEFAVTDWRLYDNVYTERYMDKPEENPEGYKFGSVLTHADKLRGKLRITAGNMDDNVHYQNTLQLIDKLENLGKSFELMIYTNERHGYRMKWLHAAKENLDFWKRSFNLNFENR